MTRAELIEKLTALCGPPEWLRYPAEHELEVPFAVARFRTPSVTPEILAAIEEQSHWRFVGIDYRCPGWEVRVHTDIDDAPPEVSP